VRVPDNTPRPRSLDRGEGIVQPVSEEADQLSRRLHHPAPGRKAGGFLAARGVAPHLTPRTEFDSAFRTARPLAQELPGVIGKNRSPGLRVSQQKPETQHSGRALSGTPTRLDPVQPGNPNRLSPTAADRGSSSRLRIFRPIDQRNPVNRRNRAHGRNHALSCSHQQHDHGIEHPQLLARQSRSSCLFSRASATCRDLDTAYFQRSLCAGCRGCP